MKIYLNREFPLQNQSSKPLLKDQGNITPEVLYDIIKFDNGRTDHVAVRLYTDARSWYKPKKTIKEGNVVYSSKLHRDMYKTSRKALAKRYKVSEETIRLKLIKLEDLGLANRAFTDDRDYHDREVNNVLNIIVWKDTPHFCNEFGLEKTAQNLALCHRGTTLSDLPPSPNGFGVHISNTNNLAVEKKGSTSLSISTLPLCNLPSTNENVTPGAPQSEPQESISQTQMSPMSHEGSSPSEPDASHIATQQTKLPELKRKIAKTFGVKTAQELAYETTYIELTDHKLTVKLGENVKLTDYDKERLRDCIKAVYGKNVEIVTSKPKVNESVTNCHQLKATEEPKLDHTENILNMVEIGSNAQSQTEVSTVRKNRTSKPEPKNEEPMTLALAIPTEQIAAIIPYIPTTPIWDKVREALIYKHGSDLVNVRFKRLEITEQDGIITFTGPLSNTECSIRDFDLELKDCSELYGIVFKFIGVCQRTREVEERIIKSWNNGA